MMTTTPEAVAFHYARGGWCTPPGRMACAIASAEAEQSALDRGWSFHVEDDPESPDWGDIDPTDDERERCLHLCVTLTDADGTVLTSLGGILVTPEDEDNYLRAIKADLALEALPTRKATP